MPEWKPLKKAAIRSQMGTILLPERIIAFNETCVVLSGP